MKKTKNKRLYNIWSCMKQRCNNPNHTAASWYHDKGIRVCEEWKDFYCFQKWALENGYKETLCIDRIDSDKGYEPSNCQWISMDNNRRKALEEGRKSNGRKNTAKHGIFMVVKVTRGRTSAGRLALVIKTGLSKHDSLVLAESLEKEKKSSKFDFYSRVTDKNKEGDIVFWEDLKHYARKGKRQGTEEERR